MKVFKIFTLLWIALSSCVGETKSVDLKDYYTPKEILELQKLIQFVDKEITHNCGDAKLACYNKFFNQFENLEASAELKLPISQKGELQLLKNIDSDIFKDIWKICEFERSYKKDSTVIFQSICLNPKGRFAKFLIDLTDEHEKLKDYGKTFEIMGDYTPAMNGIVIKCHDWFNIDSQDELLLMTIHLLTLNYPEKIE